MNRLKTKECFHAMFEDIHSMPGNVGRAYSCLDYTALNGRAAAFEYSTPARSVEASIDGVLVRCVSFSKPLPINSPLNITAGHMVESEVFPKSSYYANESLLYSALIIHHEKNSAQFFGRVLDLFRKQIGILQSFGLGYGLIECATYKDKKGIWRASLSFRVGEKIFSINDHIHGFVLLDAPVPEE